METVRQSLKTIEGLRILYPGTWQYRGTCWCGEQFNVTKREGKYYRLDTDEQIEIFPHRKKRSHFIHRLLEDKFGGKWLKHNVLTRWRSEQHPFFVYRSNEGLREKGMRPVYRRSDNLEIVYRSTSRRFYGEEHEGPQASGT